MNRRDFMLGATATVLVAGVSVPAFKATTWYVYNDPNMDVWWVVEQLPDRTERRRFIPAWWMVNIYRAPPGGEMWPAIADRYDAWNDAWNGEWLEA